MNYSSDMGPSDMTSLQNVLDDLLELATAHPALTSALLRLLRAVREAFVDVYVEGGVTP